MPFDISDSQAVTMEDSSVLTAYAEDWLSNAFSMIHHSATETDQGADQEAQSEQASGTETQNESGPSD